MSVIVGCQGRDWMRSVPYAGGAGGLSGAPLARPGGVCSRYVGMYSTILVNVVRRRSM